MISINYGWLFWLLINSFGNWKIKLFLRVVYYFMHLLWFPHCVIRALTNKSKNMREIFLIKSAKKFGASRRLCVWLGSSLLRSVPYHRVTTSRRRLWFDVYYCNLPGHWLSVTLISCATRLWTILQMRTHGQSHYALNFKSHIGNYFNRVLYAVCF